MDLKQYIMEVPDFPKKGILFRDITPLLQNPAAFRYTTDEFAKIYEGEGLDVIVAIEARGLFFGAALAYKLGVSLVPVRNPGKLPRATVGVEYTLEYGTSRAEIHEDAVHRGQRVLIIDDLLATGGTAGAAIELVEKREGIIVSIAFLVELVDINGRSRLKGYPVTSLIRF